MVEVNKSSSVYEKAQRIRDGGDIKAESERLELIEALRHGNIYEVMAKSPNFKVSDFTDFFSSQYRNYKGQIVQDTEIKAPAAAYYEPDMNRFPIHYKGVALNNDERELYGKAMTNFLSKGFDSSASGSKYKAETATQTKSGSSTTDKPMSDAEVRQQTQGTLDEWNQLLSDSWGEIFDTQMMADYEKKMGEIKAEVEKILAMVKSGAIDPEYALLALTKANVSKNGFLMTKLGQKEYHINEQMSKISDDLNKVSITDPNYYAAVQTAQSRTRDGSFQLNLLTTDMQKVMQDVASTLEFVKSFMDQWGQHKREIIQKYSAQH